MLEVGRRKCFGVEAAHFDFIGKLSREDHLQGDDPIKTQLPRLEDDTHASSGHLADNFIVAEATDAGELDQFAPRQNGYDEGRDGLDRTGLVESTRDCGRVFRRAGLLDRNVIPLRQADSLVVVVEPAAHLDRFPGRKPAPRSRPK